MFQRKSFEVTVSLDWKRKLLKATVANTKKSYTYYKYCIPPHKVVKSKFELSTIFLPEDEMAS